MMSTASRHAHVLRLAAAAARPQPSLPRCPQASAALEHAPGLKSTHPLKVADEVGMALSGTHAVPDHTPREPAGQNEVGHRRRSVESAVGEAALVVELVVELGVAP